jgi:hypothetical protein
VAVFLTSLTSVHVCVVNSLPGNSNKFWGVPLDFVVFLINQFKNFLL